ncbi:MAG: hypothetical protein K2G87_00250, partial [Oscillospiraceae bacterium]|nr:hypothetical protein [Oscillospiraceae bacterium]
CALILICGITVSAAANMGWTHKLFGSSAALIEENVDDYSVKIGNVKIENAEGLNCKFTLGDVISDGNMLFINLLVEDTLGELQWDGERAAPGTAVALDGSALRYSWITSTWTITDQTENTVSTAIIAKFNNSIKKGDVVEFRLTNSSLRHDFLTPEEAKKWRSDLATVSFEIQSDVNTAKTINVNRTAVFKNRPDPEWEFTELDDDKLVSAEINIDTITISPFSFELSGTADLSQYVGLMNSPETGWGNIWFIYKNGERVCFQPDTTTMKVTKDHKEVWVYGDFSNSNGGTPMGVQNLNEIEAIEFDGVTVPLAFGDE